MPYINASVKKLNMAIESAKSIADATGQDPNAFVARTLLGAGLDPNSDNGKTSQMFSENHSELGTLRRFIYS